MVCFCAFIACFFYDISIVFVKFGKRALKGVGVVRGMVYSICGVGYSEMSRGCGRFLVFLVFDGVPRMANYNDLGFYT